MQTEKVGYYIPALDGIRVVFMLLVVWFHFWQQSWINPVIEIFGLYIDLNFIVRNGFMTVEGFFVLSGFCLYLPVAREGREISFREFYLRRAIRIMPSLTVCMLVCLLVLLPDLNGDPDEIKSAVSSTFAHIFFISNFNQGWFFNTPNNVIWSIVIEAQFYMLFPLAVPFFKKRPFLIASAMLIMCTIYRMFISWSDNFSVFYMHALPGVLDAFILGMLGAVIVSEINLTPRGATLMFVTGATFFLVLCNMIELRPEEMSVQIPQIRLRPLFMFAFVLMMIASPFLGKGLQKALGNKAIRFLSAISLNVFLWHQWLSWRMKSWHIPAYDTSLEYPMYDSVWQWRYVPLFIIFTLIISIAATYLLEKPAAKYLTAYFSRRR